MQRALGIDALIGELSRHQHGAFTRAQFLALGGTDRQLAWRATHGSLLRRAPGVYAPAAAIDNTLHRAMVALLAVGPSAALAGSWAAWWWGLPGFAADHNVRAPVEVIARPTVTMRRRDVRVHRAQTGELNSADVLHMTTHLREKARLEASERRRLARGGDRYIRRRMDEPRAASVHNQVRSVLVIPRVTGPDRTVIDLLRWSSEGDRVLARVVDDVVSSGLCPVESLLACAERLLAPNNPRRGQVMQRLERVRSGYVAPDSELERVGLEAFALWKCPVPTLQAPVPGRAYAEGQVDFAWPEHRVVIELDGRRHLSEAQIIADRRRDRSALLAGWRPFRFGWDDFHRNRRATREQVRTIFGIGRAAGPLNRPT